MKKNSGFTLVETLLSLAVLGILLSFVVQTVVSEIKYTTSTVTQASLVDDVRVAGQMIADQVGKAVYVFSPGTSISLSNTGNGWTKTASDGSTTWNVADADNPFIAFIEPPKVRAPSSLCAPTSTNSFSNLTTPTRDACLTFVAYYVLIRSDVVTNATGANNPGPDLPANNSKRMIYEYRVTLPYGRLVNEAQLPNSSAYTAYEGKVSQVVSYVGSATNLSGNLVADYIRYVNSTTPMGFRITPVACRGADGNLIPSSGTKVTTISQAGCPTTVSATNLNAFISSMNIATLYLQGERKLSNGQVVTTPEYSFPLVPRNLPVPNAQFSLDITL